MSIVSVIGIAAAICTTVSFIPQVLKTVKTGQTKDISLSMYLIFTTGIALWLIYGILIGDLPIIMANTVTVFLTSIVVVMKLKNG
ncbi:MAG TPA: SemiSWEET transporter [bacterium]|nr:SemiSWEET transporter [bacterium]